MASTMRERRTGRTGGEDEDVSNITTTTSTAVPTAAQRKSQAAASSPSLSSSSSSTSSSPARQLTTSFSDLVLAVACFYAAYVLIETQGRKRFINPNSATYTEGLLEHLLVRGGNRLYAAIAFILIGIAASWGVLRFARVRGTTAPHEFFTHLALFISTPLLGLCAYTWIGTMAPALDFTFNLSHHDFLFFGFLFLLFNFFVIYGLIVSSTPSTPATSSSASLQSSSNVSTRGPSGAASTTAGPSSGDAKQLYTLVTGALAMLAIIYLGVLHIAKNPAHPQEGQCLIGGAVLYVLSGTVIGSTGYYFGSIPRVDIFHYALTAANLLIASAFNDIFD